MKERKDFNLLIVDDELGIRKALTTHFKMDGYTVFTAGSGHEALEIVKLNKIHFVITDMRMPEGDGQMLLKKIREINPDIPIVVMITGYSEFTKKEALEQGAIDLLPKPIDLAVMEKYIERTIKRTLLIAEF